MIQNMTSLFLFFFILFVSGMFAICVWSKVQVNDRCFRVGLHSLIVCMLRFGGNYFNGVQEGRADRNIGWI